jgi:RNA polymerase sigma-70 factor, ECF subfamily
LVASLEQVFREQWGRVLATLIGFLGDFDLAEEAAREASRSPRDAGRGTDIPPSRAPGW